MSWMKMSAITAAELTIDKIQMKVLLMPSKIAKGR
jgi:hypothetical protein